MLKIMEKLLADYLKIEEKDIIYYNKNNNGSYYVYYNYDKESTWDRNIELEDLLVFIYNKK